MNEETNKQSEEEHINLPEEDPLDADVSGASNTEETITTFTTTEEKEMEVHHHGHVHEKRKWKEYVFQFFMLFLAVFCGFLAEYKLEHYIEKERAEELSQTLYEEMRGDSANLTLAIANRIHKEGHLQYVGQYFKDSSLTQLSAEFYPRYTWGIFMNSYIVFEPKDGMLEQLKNSGSLRFFKNINIQKAVSDFSVAVNNLRTRLERESDLLATINRDMLLKHYDFNWLNQITNNGEFTSNDALKIYEAKKQIIPAGLINLEGIDTKATSNYMIYHNLVLRSTRLGQMEEYKEKSNRLIKLLRDEYRLQ